MILIVLAQENCLVIKLYAAAVSSVELILKKNCFIIKLHAVTVSLVELTRKAPIEVTF